MVDAAELAYNAIAAQLAEWDDAVGTSDAVMVEGVGTESNVGFDIVDVDVMEEEEDEAKVDIAAVPTTTTFTSTTGSSSILGNKPSNSSSRGSSRSSTYRKNQEYHDALAHYLEQYQNATQRLMVRNQQLLNNDGHIQDLQEEIEEIQTFIKQKLPSQFIKGLIAIAAETSSSFTKPNNKTQENEEEWTVWTLLYQLLHHNGIEATIYIPPSSTKHLQLFQWQAEDADINNFIDASQYPAQIVQKMINTDPNSISSTSSSSSKLRDFIRVLQRRITILQWVEACIAQQQKSILLLPPKSRNLIPFRQPPQQQQNQKYQHLDTNLTTSTFSGTNKQQTNNHNLTVDEAELLKAVITMIQCGNLSGAKQCCIDAGQSWRAATLIGGQFYGTTEAEGDTTLNVTMVGNPNRMQWKRQCQLLAQELFQRYQREGIGMASSISSSSSDVQYTNIVYEAALYAILARDVPRALQNPMLQSSWYTQLWIYFSAMVECSLDQVLEYHTARQSHQGTKFPFSSAIATFPSQHQDYVDINASTDEMDVINALSSYTTDRGHRSYGNSGGNTLNNNTNTNNSLYRLLIYSIIAGKESIYNFLMHHVYPLCQQQQQQQGNSTIETTNALSHEALRFLTHFILILRLSFGEEFPELPHTQEMMLILRTYIHSLMTSTYKKFNVPLLALYTSLLSPVEILVDTYVSCCLLDDVYSTDTDESEAIRKVMVDLARKHFSSGLDLIILRRVVKKIIEEPDMFPHDDMESIWSEQGVELHPSDLYRLQALQWLCFYPEHRLDAIVFANALMRRLLLASSSSTESVEEDIFTIRNTSNKMTHCKIFITKFFPTDSRSVVQEYYLTVSSSADEFNNEPCTASASIDDAILTEHSALIAFLEAHTAFEEWCRVITLCEQSQPPSFGSEYPQPGGLSAAWNAAETEIARQQEYRSYKHKMVNLARMALEATETAQRLLLNVLTFPGGWLDHQVCGIQAMKSISSPPPEEWDLNSRENEIFSLRKTFVFRSIIMLYSVLDGTACWVQKFSTSFDVERERELFLDFVNKNNDFSSFHPQYWHKKCMELSELIIGHDLQETMSREQIQCFLRLMAESAVHLIRCSDGSSS